MRYPSIKIASCFIAACIGAGFASGKEIVNFFVKYGKMSTYGLFLSGVLFFIFTHSLYNLIYFANKNNTNDVYRSILSGRILSAFRIITPVMLFSLFSVMIAGMGAVTEEYFGINNYLACVISTVICLLIFLSGKSAVILSSEIIAPTICSGILITGLYFLIFSTKAVFNPFEKLSASWIWSSALYVSYNCVPLICFFAETRELFTSKKIATRASTLGASVLMIISLVLSYLLNMFYVKVKVLDIPMLYITEQIGHYMSIFYIIVLYLAMISTAISNGFALINTISIHTKVKKHYLYTAFCSLSLILSFAGFSELVGILYPFFGYIGMVFFIAVVYKHLTFRKK